MSITARLTTVAGLALSLTLCGPAFVSAQQPGAGSRPDPSAPAPRQQPPTRPAPTATQNATTTKLAAADVTFLQNAGRDGKAEVEAAQLAQEKSSAAVKSFAARLVDDHSKANAELATLAQQKGVTVPDVSASQRSMKGKLDTMSGATFDRTWTQHMVADHEKAVAAFTKAATSKDPDVKAFAEKTLPALKAHLAEAKQLQGTLANTKPASAPAGKSAAPPAPTPRY
jgi:putative membrane protein